MLDQVTLEYLNSPDGRILTYSLLIVLGGVIAVINNRSDATLTRWPFFAYSTLIMLLLSGVGLLLRQLAPVMAGGQLWLLILAQQGTCGLAGYTLGTVAMARCRDSYGRDRKGLVIAAIFGFVVAQISIFVLLLKGTRDMESEEQV